MIISRRRWYTARQRRLFARNIPGISTSRTKASKVLKNLINSNIVALGRQAPVPRICVPVYGMLSSSEVAAPSVQPEGSASKTSDVSAATGEHFLQILPKPAGDSLLQTDCPSEVSTHFHNLQSYSDLTVHTITAAWPIYIALPLLYSCLIVQVEGRPIVVID